MIGIRKMIDRCYPFIFAHTRGLDLGKNVKFWGKPLIDIRGNGRIIIGDNSQIISTNYGSHVNYGVPTKLIVDRPGAEIVIGENCSIGGACLHAYKSIRVGNNCLIGTGSNVIDANGHPIHLDKFPNRRSNLDDSKPIVIEKNVWITLNCIILPGSMIGEGSIISANTVINGNIAPYSIVAGNPAQVVGRVRH